jgi:hypothetical protein
MKATYSTSGPKAGPEQNALEPAPSSCQMCLRLGAGTPTICTGAWFHPVRLELQGRRCDVLRRPLLLVAGITRKVVATDGPHSDCNRRKTKATRARAGRLQPIVKAGGEHTEQASNNDRRNVRAENH